MIPLGYIVDHLSAFEAIRRRQRPRNGLLLPVDKANIARDSFLWFGDMADTSVGGDSNEMPELVFAPEHQLRDLLSRLLTYGGDLFPVTSITRILPYSLKFCLRSDPRPRNSRLDTAAVRAAFGELAEVSGPGSGGTVPTTLSVHRQIRNSFLWVAAQVRCREGVDASLLLSRWERAQSLARASSPTRVALSEHRRLAAMLLAEQYEELQEHHVCAEMLSAIAQHRWQDGVELAARVIRVAAPSMEELSQGPYERRVATAIALVNAGIEVNIDPVSKAMAAALLFAAVTKGSMEHFHVAVRYADRIPGVCIWYGIFSGLGEPEIARRAALEYRLTRVVQREMDAWRPIEADIGLEELEILAASSATKVRAFASLASIEVEILPMVAVPIRWQDTGEGPSERGRAEGGHSQQLKLVMQENSAVEDRVAQQLDSVKVLLGQALAAIGDIRSSRGAQSLENLPNRNRKPKSRGVK